MILNLREPKLLLMKTLLLSAVIIAVSILDTSCVKPTVTTFGNSEDYEIIDRRRAEASVQSLRKAKERRKWIYKNYVDHRFLGRLFTDTIGKPIDSVKFMFGAVTVIDSRGKKRNLITTIVQVKRKARNDSQPIADTYEYYRLKPDVCPPPYGVNCPMELVD